MQGALEIVRASVHCERFTAECKMLGEAET
jgi:hypothetical protein